MLFLPFVHSTVTILLAKAVDGLSCTGATGFDCAGFFGADFLGVTTFLTRAGFFATLEVLDLVD
jgi:hypothetical protein